MGESLKENLDGRGIFKKYPVSSLIESSKTKFFYYSAMDFNNPVVEILKKYERNPSEEIRKQVDLQKTVNETNRIISALKPYYSEIEYLTVFSKYSMEAEYSKKDGTKFKSKPITLISKLVGADIQKEKKQIIYNGELIKNKDEFMEYVSVNDEVVIQKNNSKNVFLITDKLHIRTINAIAQSMFYDDDNLGSLFVLALEDYI